MLRYLEKRPRLKKPRRANTRMTMMMIQRIDTVILSLEACRDYGVRVRVRRGNGRGVPSGSSAR